MFLAVLVTVISFLIGIWNLTIAILGLFPKCKAMASGTLTKVFTERNVRVKYRTIPVLTQYTYTYTVKGRTYRYRSEGFHSGRRLFAKVAMVYVKGFPRHAYPNRFSGVNEWILGISMLVMGCLFLFAFVFGA